MLARVAENIYWLSRYLERAENTVRLVDVHSRMLIDLPEIQEHQGWIPLVLINALTDDFEKKYDSANEVGVCHFLLADRDNPGSLLNAFVAIQNNLRSCRDVLPRSSYEAINSACRFVQEHIEKTTLNARERCTFLKSVENRLQAIAGNISSNMSHDIGYRFMRMGCLIERADMSSRIIDVQSSWQVYSREASSIALQQQRWFMVLRSLSAVQMYRQHMKRPITGEDTLSFLLHNQYLPRSITFCVDELDVMLNKLGSNDAPKDSIEKLRQTLQSPELSTLAQQPLQLHQFIDSLQVGTSELASAIAKTYFLEQKDTE